MPIRFNMNKQRAIEAVLWVIQNGESNMYNIWKILFEAEKYHLNKYGCPITGDQYLAMVHGTVPMWLYDETKAGNNDLSFSLKENNCLVADRKPMMDYLSKSHINALKLGFDKYAGLGFKDVRDKNHAEQAWKKNYVSDKRTLIPFEDIIEEDWLKEDLAVVSRAMVV
jgi:uncharacterized phage-associated protein